MIWYFFHAFSPTLKNYILPIFGRYFGQNMFCIKIRASGMARFSRPRILRGAWSWAYAWNEDTFEPSTTAGRKNNNFPLEPNNRTRSLSVTFTRLSFSIVSKKAFRVYHNNNHNGNSTYGWRRVDGRGDAEWGAVDDVFALNRFKSQSMEDIIRNIGM